MSYEAKLVGLEGYNVQQCAPHLSNTFLEYIQSPECAVFHEYIGYDEFGTVAVGPEDEWECHKIDVFRNNGRLLFSLYKNI